MRIALAQINPLVGDLEGNASLILEATKQAAKSKVDLVVTPELSLLGYPPRDLLLQPSINTRQIKVLEKLSKEVPAGINLLVGITEKCDDIGLPNQFNAVALVKDSSWKVVARKRLLPTYDVFDERRYFQPSDKPWLIDLVCDNRSWKIALTICEDLWVKDDIHIYRLAESDPIKDLEALNPDLLVNLSASPFGQGKVKLRRELALSASSRLKCPVLYINQVGGNDELVFDGGSFVIEKQGGINHQLAFAESDLQIWDSNNIKVALKETSPQSIPSPDELLVKSLILGLKDYSRKCGFENVLLGLSGGIDSALVALIAVAALGPKKVQALLMPSPWSSTGSIVDAKSLANRLGIINSTVPIESIMEKFDSALRPALGKSLEGLAAENLQSRIRGTLLMGMANQQGQLLLTTGNKSELAVGYCTLYGDMNGGLGVIGDLYKTTVFRLCDWIDSTDSIHFRKKFGLMERCEVIGEAIRKKPPSAELRPDQLDCDSLPNYEILDPILKAIIENHKTIDELIAEGHDKEIVKSTTRLIKRSEFKRRQSAPVLKVSQRAFGSGWRMPIASSF